MGFDVPADAAPNDMVVAHRAADDDARSPRAVDALDAALARRPAAESAADTGLPPAPTIGTAARRVEADLALDQHPRDGWPRSTPPTHSTPAST